MTEPTDDPTLQFLKPRDLELGPFSEPDSRTPQEPSPWRHWRMKTDADGVAWLLIDKQGASANTLSTDVLAEFDTVLAKIEQDRPRALVIRSAKPSGFVAGADIREFRDFTSTAKVEEVLTRGHAILDRLDRLPLPTIAVVHGYCLGGGLELALACDIRIAVENATFGFPEVLLGLHPGLDGTVRLTRLINPMQAMTMMLTGKTEPARSAKSLGLVDAVTQERHVRAAVTAATTGSLKRTTQGLIGKALNMAPLRGLLASRMRQRDREESRESPLSRALCADRPVGEAWRRRCRHHAEGRDRLLRRIDGLRRFAKSGAGIFPAREFEEPG